MCQNSFLFILSCLVSSGSFAHDLDEETEPNPPVFSIHDTNQDGVLDRLEYERFLSLNARYQHKPPLSFQEVDADNNGKITENEMIQRLNHQLRQRKRIRAREGWW